MDYKYINQLLERYWAAETTLEEEEILRTFFSQIDIPAELEKYRILFTYENVAKKTEVLGGDFDEKMLSMTGEQNVVKARTITFSQRLIPLFRAAAIVAIILTLGNAAQVPFHDNHANVADVETDRIEGVSMALNGDSATIDSMQQSNLKELPMVANPMDIAPEATMTKE